MTQCQREPQRIGGFLTSASARPPQALRKGTIVLILSVQVGTGTAAKIKRASLSESPPDRDRRHRLYMFFAALDGGRKEIDRVSGNYVQCESDFSDG